MSSHGVHLTGLASFCARFVLQPKSELSATKSFLLAALAWLDVLRGFSGAEKLTYSDEVRQVILNSRNYPLESFVGCPAVIFRRICKVLSAAKAHRAGTLSLPDFEQALSNTDTFLRAWSPEDEVYPTSDPHWQRLAHAYRHACLLRIIRFPDAFIIPCDDARVKLSVVEILDVCARIPSHSPFHKRLLFPLFMAGADTASPHQQDYVSLRMNAICTATGFRHEAMLDIMRAVWAERVEGTQGWTNAPWMEWTCSTHMQRQHDYLLL
ncbi:hypothetical protein LTR27_011770 [Elasticomyces elasticus]|nr:hypothetical protein LTR27_011770 [Elasticomyces elasticus]